MNEEKDTSQEEMQQYEVMPGADKIDDSDAPMLDLSFAEEVAEEVAEDTTEDTTEDEAEVEEEATADSEEEATADSEEVAEDEAEEVAEEVPAKKNPMVPKSRLDEVLTKQKALQKQLDDIKAASEKSEEAPEEYDFDAKEGEYQTMVLDGETDKAVALRREIRKAERGQLEFEMRQEMSQTVQQDRAATALQQAATAMEESYPMFDQNSDSFDESLTNDVVELRDAFIFRGYEPVDALNKAVNFVVKDNQLTSVVDEAIPALASSSKKSVDEVAKKRSQVSKKLAAAESQPPELPGESVGRSDPTVDVASMTEDEFNALPEATLKRMRGDIL
jgi:hypothetical protein